MRLCMFHPVDQPLERGWVGRIDGPHVVQLAAQTLQSFFTGGGKAREHAVYPLEAVRLLAPVLHPPAVRIFEDESTFEFANPAAVAGPGAEVGRSGDLVVHPRLAGVVGADGALGGFTLAAEWRRSSAPRPKDRDFALVLGPVLVTPEELDLEREAAVVARVDGSERPARLPAFDWTAAVGLAARGTRLYPGDVVAAPGVPVAVGDGETGEVEVESPSIGSLSMRAVGRG